MRKAVLLIIVGLLMLSAVCAAEGTAGQSYANGQEAVRIAQNLYCTIPDGNGWMLVRVNQDGKTALCLDRADSFDSLLPYEDGILYLKTSRGSSAIMSCSNDILKTIYGFGSASASNLAIYGDRLLVITGGLMYSIDPDTQVCLKMTGNEMSEFILENDCAFFCSATDTVEYTAKLENGETLTKKAGCLYTLDMKNGNVRKLVEYGGEGIKASDSFVWFHNLADAYAGEGQNRLSGYLYEMDQEDALISRVCSEPDDQYWITNDGLLVLSNRKLMAMEEGEGTEFFEIGANASVFYDGDYLYIWDPDVAGLAVVSIDGDTKIVFKGDLRSVPDAVQPVVTPEATAAPEIEEFLPAFTATTEPVVTDAQPVDWFVEAEPTAIPDTQANGSGRFSSYTPIPTETEEPAVKVYDFSSVNEDDWNFGEETIPADTSIEVLTPQLVSSVTTRSDVNMRTGAGTSYSKVTTVPAGTNVECQDCVTNANGSAWFKVSYNGRTGWISALYVVDGSAIAKTYSGANSGSTSAQAAAPTAAPSVSENTQSGGATEYRTYDVKGSKVSIKADVNVRSGPGKGYSVIDYIPKGKKASLLGVGAEDSDGNHWYKVKYNGTTGWISRSYATIKDDGSSSSSASYVRTTGEVYLRSGPSKNYDIEDSVPSGTKLKYMGSSKKDSRGVVWYKVKYNGQVCWVSSKYSKLVK